MDWDWGRVTSETFIRQVRAFETLPSTNDLALELAGVGADAGALPCLIVTEEQTAGRGRGTHRWWSAAESLTFSVLLDPAALGLDGRHLPRSSLVTALAVIDAVAPMLGPMPIGLRWPNDVYAAGRKLAGILPQPVRSAAGLRLVIGVGLNVNTRFAEGPVELRRTATSLADLTGHDHDRFAVLMAVLRGLSDGLHQLAVDSPSLPARWRRWCLLRGQVVCWSDGLRTVRGTCPTIDDAGALVLQTPAGPERFFGGSVLGATVMSEG